MKRNVLVILVFISIVFFALGIVYTDIICGKWDAHKVYKEYSSAVWLVHTKWGYQIIVNDEDYTRHFFELQNKDSVNLIASFEENGEDNWTIKGGVNEGCATAFFIREDGILATNRHVLSPWLYEENHKDIENVENILRKFYTNKANSTCDMLYSYIANNLKIKGCLDSVWIVPNGGYDDIEHRIECNLLEVDLSMEHFYAKKSSEENDDVTIFQTKNGKLPSSVTKVIKDIDGWFEYDIDNPVANNRVGETIYAIGFPYGINSLASTIDPKHGQISNQIQNGIITQYRGVLNFGHNVPVANGMSGSPIINDKGSLVGIHATGYTGLNGVQGMNQGVSANLLYKCVLDWDTYNNNK